VAKTDELLEADSLDARHLFSKELVTDDDLTEIMPAVDQITLTQHKIAKRKERE
jgi:hypothetical protein